MGKYTLSLLILLCLVRSLAAQEDTGAFIDRYEQEFKKLQNRFQYLIATGTGTAANPKSFNFSLYRLNQKLRVDVNPIGDELASRRSFVVNGSNSFEAVKEQELYRLNKLSKSPKQMSEYINLKFLGADFAWNVLELPVADFLRLDGVAIDSETKGLKHPKYGELVIVKFNKNKLMHGELIFLKDYDLALQKFQWSDSPQLDGNGLVREIEYTVRGDEILPLKVLDFNVEQGKPSEVGSVVFDKVQLTPPDSNLFELSSFNLGVKKANDISIYVIITMLLLGAMLLAFFFFGRSKRLQA